MSTNDSTVQTEVQPKSIASLEGEGDYAGWT